jgi:hypothetical protein
MLSHFAGISDNIMPLLPSLLLDERLRRGHECSLFQIHGEIYHQIGMLDPVPGRPPIYAQHYLYDREAATIQCLKRNEKLNEEITRALDVILRQHSPFPETFQFTHEILQTSALEDVHLQILMKTVNDDGTDHKRYNRPTAREVVLLLVDNGLSAAIKDIVARLRTTE